MKVLKKGQDRLLLRGPSLMRVPPKEASFHQGVQPDQGSRGSQNQEDPNLRQLGMMASPITLTFQSIEHIMTYIHKHIEVHPESQQLTDDRWIR